MSQDEGAPVSSGIVDLADADNDPALQLIELVRQGRSFSGRERNCVFLNTSGEKFANVSAVSGFDYPDDARAAARVDWDQDGKIDVWCSNRNAPQVRFFHNRTPSVGNWIALRLRGTQSNRDAIGTRIVATLPEHATQPIVRTVRAGDGYLTQSSKIIQLGLGSAKTCDLTVHWPAGSKTHLKQLQCNRQYLLVEGQTQASLQPAQTTTLPDTPSTLTLPDSGEALSVFSMVRPALPRLQYRDEKGMAGDLLQWSGQPILVILWASWCQPCLLELAEIAQHRKQLEETGLRVLALTVDPLSDAKTTSASAAQQTLARMQFPFPDGVATEPLIEKLQLVNDFLFNLKKPFPVPTSFLIDPDFRLAAIYRGRIDLDRLLADVAQLDVSPRQRRQRSVPFSGRWADVPKSMPMAIEVLDLIRAGYAEDASELVQRIQHMFDRGTILQLVVRLGMAHYRQGAEQLAHRHFAMARKIQPTTVGPEIELGQWHESQREHAAAIQWYQAALRKDSRSIPALNNLAWLLATCHEPAHRNPRRAVQLATRAVKLSGNKHPATLDTLATSLAAAGQIEQANQVARRAIQLATARSQFHLAQDIRRRQKEWAR